MGKPCSFWINNFVAKLKTLNTALKYYDGCLYFTESLITSAPRALRARCNSLMQSGAKPFCNGSVTANICLIYNRVVNFGVSCKGMELPAGMNMWNRLKDEWTVCFISCQTEGLYSFGNTLDVCTYVVRIDVSIKTVMDGLDRSNSKKVIEKLKKTIFS